MSIPSTPDAALDLLDEQVASAECTRVRHVALQKAIQILRGSMADLVAKRSALQSIEKQRDILQQQVEALQEELSERNRASIRVVDESELAADEESESQPSVGKKAKRRRGK